MCHFFLLNSKYNGKISGQRANDLQYFMVTPECSGWECGRLDVHIILTNTRLPCSIEPNPSFLLSRDKKAQNSRPQAQIEGQETITQEGDATRTHRDNSLHFLLESILGKLLSFRSAHMERISRSCNKSVVGVCRDCLLNYSFPFLPPLCLTYVSFSFHTYVFRLVKSLLLILRRMFAKANSKSPYSCS